MTREPSFSVVLSLKCVTGLHRPGDETQILGAGREKSGGPISPGVGALRQYLADALFVNMA